MEKKNVPPDIYAQAAAIAKSYYVMLQRRRLQEQQPPARIRGGGPSIPGTRAQQLENTRRRTGMAQNAGRYRPRIYPAEHL